MSDRNMRLKETKGVHACKVIAANVGRKAKHIAGEACPSWKLVALGLVDRKLVGCKFCTFEVSHNMITALEIADTCGKLTVTVFTLSTAIKAC